MIFFKKKKPLEKKESASGSVVSMYNVGDPVWSGRDYASFAKEAYIRNVIANRSVSLIAKSIASLSWKVYQGDQEVTNAPLLALLANPNETQAQSDFFEALASYYLIAGNSYIEAAYPNGNTKPSKSPPKYLYILRPDKMKVIKGRKGKVVAYEFSDNGSKVQWPVSIGGVSNVLHIKSFNPTDYWYGLSNVEAGAYAIDQHNQAASWNQALLQNSARPSGAIVYKNNEGVLSDDQYQRLKSEVEDKYSGSRSAGKPMLLEGGLEWQEMGLSPKDMDWLEGKNGSARDIALAFGVPSQLLGIPGDATYSNMQEARLALWEQTILPLADEITAHLNKWLVPRFGENQTLAYCKENIEPLRQKREMQRQSLEGVSFMTINEKREAIGLEPIEGGDELLVDSNKVPVNFAMDLTSDSDLVKNIESMGYTKQEAVDIVYGLEPKVNKDLDLSEVKKLIDE